MSTRSIIARPTTSGFEGRYHHSDGYPSGLGAYLYSLRDRFVGDYAGLMHFLLEEHPAGWSLIVGADLSLPPMRWRSDAGVDWDKPYGPRCYCHGGRSEGAAPFITSYGEDDGGARYVYELHPDRMVIRSVTWHADATTPVERRFPIIADIRWSDPAPAWARLDAR